MFEIYWVTLGNKLTRRDETIKLINLRITAYHGEKIMTRLSLYPS